LIEKRLALLESAPAKIKQDALFIRELESWRQRQQDLQEQEAQPVVPHQNFVQLQTSELIAAVEID